MSESSPHYTDRHGLTRQPRSAGSVLYLVIAGALVAGAGVAGLHYRERLWDDPANRDYSASPGEPSSTELTIAHLSHKDDLGHISTVVTTQDATDAGVADEPTKTEALKAEGPKPKAPTPSRSHGRTKPKVGDPSDQASSDAFAKPE